MSTSAMINEKRRHRRVPFGRPVSVTKFTGETAAMKAVDFSLEGLRFTSNIPSDVGDILTVTMNIAPQGKVKVIKALGEVVYRYQENEQFHIGMRFFKNT